MTIETFTGDGIAEIVVGTPSWTEPQDEQKPALRLVRDDETD